MSLNLSGKCVDFIIWKDLVDSFVFIATGYHLDDLPDEDFRINFDNGLHVCDMAKIVIKNNE